jgi:hypothetical protein
MLIYLQMVKNQIGTAELFLMQENVWFEKVREYKLMIFKPVVGSTASTTMNKCIIW